MSLTVLLTVAAFAGRSQTGSPVICLGDSLCPRLAAPIADAFGLSTTVKVLSHPTVLPVQADVDAALATDHALVLLNVGSDAASAGHWDTMRNRFVPTLESIIARAQTAKSNVRLALCIPPPDVWSVGDPRKERYEQEILPLLRQVGRETGCLVVDFSDALSDRLDLITDGVVPTTVGAQILADTVYETVHGESKAGWRILFSDSEEPEEGPAKNAIDGDVDTYWHTNYSTTDDKYPHEIQVDTGAERAIGGFSYTPRQDGVNGRVAGYEFYVSSDGKNWGSPVAKGRFMNVSKTTKVFFASPHQDRYFRFRALSEQQGQNWASAAEIGILKFYPKRQ